MRKLLLTLGLLFGLSAPALAQIPCIGVGGVNNVPQVGLACVEEPTVNTFAATSVGLATASTATDVSCLSGAANKVIRIQQIRLNGSAGTAIVVPVVITKHVSLDTGGTPATGNALPVAYTLDSSNGTPAAVPTAYTANPTIADGSPGFVDSGQLPLTTTSSLSGVSPGLSFDYQFHQYMEVATLRTAAQQVCVNFQSTTVSSGVINITWRWTEASQ